MASIKQINSIILFVSSVQLFMSLDNVGWYHCLYQYSGCMDWDRDTLSSIFHWRFTMGSRHGRYILGLICKKMGLYRRYDGARKKYECGYFTLSFYEKSMGLIQFILIHVFLYRRNYEYLAIPEK